MNKDELQVFIFLRLLWFPSVIIHTRLTFCKTGTDKNKDILKYHVKQCGTKIASMRELASFSCYFLALNSSFINVHSTYFQKCLNGIYTTTKHNIICTYRQILSKALAWKNALRGWLQLNQCVLSVQLNKWKLSLRVFPCVGCPLGGSISSSITTKATDFSIS